MLYLVAGKKKEIRVKKQPTKESECLIFMLDTYKRKRGTTVNVLF